MLIVFSCIEHFLGATVRRKQKKTKTKTKEKKKRRRNTGTTISPRASEMTSSELQNLTWIKGHTAARARLMDAQLWSEFLAIDNEMIVTKTGR